MASGAEMRGQVAKTMAGADRVEIKATSPEKQINAVLENTASNWTKANGTFTSSILPTWSYSKWE